MTTIHHPSNFNLPNLLSILRILMIPLALWGMIKEEYLFSFTLLIMAGITDALDGFLARKLGQFTPMGRVLDPLADKVLFVSVFITMGFWLELFPDWFSWMIVGRDLLILGGFFTLILSHKNRSIEPTLSGKIHTILLFIFLCVVLLSLSYGVSIPLNLLMYGMALSTLLSLGGYFRVWLRRMSSE